MNRTIIYTYSPEDLEKIIRDCIKSELANFTPQIPTQSKKFISRKKTASILGISLVTLGDYCKRGIIPSYRIGSKVLFIESEIIESVTLVKSVKNKKGGIEL